MFKTRIVNDTELKKVLSKKELEIFPQWLSSLSYKEISEVTSRSEATTKSHVHNIIQKTGFKDKASALAISIARGWIEIKEVGGKGLLAIIMTLFSSLISDDDFTRPNVKTARVNVTHVRSRDINA